MNKSGITPVEYKILVLPEQVKTESEGGIVFTGKKVQEDELAQTEGILVAKTDMSFAGWACKIPKVGDRVKFAKYSGLMVDGEDGKRYRIIEDKNVVAILGAKP